MFTAGVIILMGFVFIGIKLPRRTALWLLGRPLMLDISVSVLAYALHWGTFTGVMAAAIAGLMCSVFTAVCRWAFGYIRGNVYYPGKLWRYQ